jgi:quercetin dioxygenase-like cupin family protein
MSGRDIHWSDVGFLRCWREPISKRGGVIVQSNRSCSYLVLAFALALGAMAIGPAASQQQAAPVTKVSTLLKQAIAEFPGREIVMVTLDIPPGGGSAPHRHPGHHIFGYVLEGSYRIKLDDGAEKTLTKGETFHEAPGQLHAVSANASQSEPAKVLAFIIAESGKPITVPEKQ